MMTFTEASYFKDGHYRLSALDISHAEGIKIRLAYTQTAVVDIDAELLLDEDMVFIKLFLTVSAEGLFISVCENSKKVCYRWEGSRPEDLILLVMS